MSNQMSKEIRLASRPEGTPAPNNFELAETAAPSPSQGQALVRNIWMSVDPYMRGRMMDVRSYVPPFQIGEALQGGAIGQVVESNSEKFAVGDYVSHMLGWREFAACDEGTMQKIDAPDGLPIETFLGTLGMPGLTAYAGLMAIAELKDGENVFVSAASGAVGSVVCQIAKAKNCYVVGSAGSDEKCDWLTKEAGVDKVINYKTCGNLTHAVMDAFPKGVDVYFENVGGEHLEAALTAMNPFGRMALCGMISQYNNTAPQPGPNNMILCVGKSLKLQGFIVSNHTDLLPQFIADMQKWIGSGKLKWKQTVEEGIENAPKAFINLFSGNNFGKMLVKIGPDKAV